MGCSAAASALDPLPSWNDGPARSAIVDFVETTTDATSPAYVPPGERIATFDNDGTLWVEHPLYTQVVFALDRIRAEAADHPEWRTRQPFRAVLENDREAIAHFDKSDWVQVLAATHGGMSTEQFAEAADAWLSTARDSRFRRPYTQLVYQPMLEVLHYLRANGYATFIVSGGGQEFLRVFADATYGIPTWQVVGSSVETEYAESHGVPVILREKKVGFIDDGPGKALGINRFIGKRPQIAFGNTEGDREMLLWTTSAAGTRRGFLVLHDDASRAYAYGPAEGLPETHVGAFSQELYDEAQERGWLVISMKEDWRRIFPWEKADGR